MIWKTNARKHTRIVLIQQRKLFLTTPNALIFANLLRPNKNKKWNGNFIYRGNLHIYLRICVLYYYKLKSHQVAEQMNYLR